MPRNCRAWTEPQHVFLEHQLLTTKLGYPPRNPQNQKNSRAEFPSLPVLSNPSIIPSTILGIRNSETRSIKTPGGAGENAQTNEPYLQRLEWRKNGMMCYPLTDSLDSKDLPHWKGHNGCLFCTRITNVHLAKSWTEHCAVLIFLNSRGSRRKGLSEASALKYSDKLKLWYLSLSYQKWVLVQCSFEVLQNQWLEITACKLSND